MHGAGAVRGVEFDSQGILLRGRLYESAARTPAPALIMAHGFSATIDGMVADRYAEALQAAGLTVLLYDHPYLGRSGGEPRHRISAWRQARGLIDAFAFLAREPGVLPDRIGFWGDSLSAGVAMLAAVAEPRVAALIAQVPSCGGDVPPAAPDGDEDRADRAYAEAVRETLARDLDAGAFDERPERPVVAADQLAQPSWLEPLSAFRWFVEYGGRFGTGWANRATRAEPAGAPAYLPVRCASQLRMPVLFVVARNDEMPGSREDVARDTFARLAGEKELLEIEGGHFGLLHHPSAIFDQVAAAQASFARTHLAYSASPV